MIINILFLLKDWSFYKNSFSRFFKYCGILLLGDKIISFFFEKSVNDNQLELWIFFFIIIFAVINGARALVPKLKRHIRFEGADVEIGFQVEDFFEISGDKVISTNTDLKVDLEDKGGVISEKSLQGQMLKKYYSNSDHLKLDIKGSLQDIQRPVDIGQILKIKPENETIYLIALTKLNDKGNVTNSNVQDIQKCLNRLWQFIGESGDYGHIVIPLIGTGRARISINRIDVVKEIIRSFTAAISERKFCEKLTICISPKDYKKHNINLNEIYQFIEFSCKFTEFSKNLNPPIGTKLESQG